jgi:hypothetical protein
LVLFFFKLFQGNFLFDKLLAINFKIFDDLSVKHFKMIINSVVKRDKSL